MSGKFGITTVQRLLGAVGSTVAAVAYGVKNFKAVRDELTDIQGDELVAIVKQTLETEIPKVVAVFKPDTTTLLPPA